MLVNSVKKAINKQFIKKVKLRYLYVIEKKFVKINKLDADIIMIMKSDNFKNNISNLKKVEDSLKMCIDYKESIVRTFSKLYEMSKKYSNSSINKYIEEERLKVIKNKINKIRLHIPEQKNSA